MEFLLFTVIPTIAFVIFMIVIRVWARSKTRKEKETVAAMTAQAAALRSAGNLREALEQLYGALRHVVGIGPGTTEWTSRGLCLRMEEQGREVVSAIRECHKAGGVSYDWNQFEQVIADFGQFSRDGKLVNRYGLPKRAGKGIYRAMRARLAGCLDAMPRLGQ